MTAAALDLAGIAYVDRGQLQGLQQLGWTVGQNVHIEYRWSGGNDEVTRRQAAELATPPPEVILASGSAAAGPLLQVTHPRLAKSAGTN
jgi:hypothetical protein